MMFRRSGPVRSRGPDRLLLQCLLGVSALASCATWSRPTLTPRQVVANANSGPLWIVIRGDSVPVVLVRAEISGDTLRGLVPHSAAPGHPLESMALPLPEISRLATKHTSWYRTGFVLALPMALAWIARALIGP